MPITQEQIVQRRSVIGASDVPAILGLSPWRTAYDVWAEKTGKLIPNENDTGAAAEAGNMFENGILDKAEKSLGKLARNVRKEAPSGLPIAANLDAIVVEGIEGTSKVGDNVEAKTAGLFGPLVDRWGDEYTDEVPEMYIVQANVQMLCAASDITHLQAFLGGRGFQMYRIPRNEDLIKVLIERCVEFWGRVKSDTPPDDSAMSIDTIKRIRREPNKVVVFAAAEYATIQEWEVLKDLATKSTKAAEAAKEQVLTLLGDAEAAELPSGERLTYMETSRAGYVVKPTTYRTARIVKGKGIK